MKRPRSQLFAAVLSVLFLGFVAVYYFYFAKSPVVEVPYENPAQVVSAIGSLPAIGNRDKSTGPRDWMPYISMARRVRVTDPTLIKSGFEDAMNSGPTNGPRLIQEIKIMILLRVCFKVQAGRAPAYTHGGWISDSALQAKRTIDDENWPVARRFGYFYLEDTIDGYTGAPYDPAEKFQWLLENGEWRNL